jgi:hypothetical protein
LILTKRYQITFLSMFEIAKDDFGKETLGVTFFFPCFKFCRLEPKPAIKYKWTLALGYIWIRKKL